MDGTEIEDLRFERIYENIMSSVNPSRAFLRSLIYYDWENHESARVNLHCIRANIANCLMYRKWTKGIILKKVES